MPVSILIADPSSTMRAAIERAIRIASLPLSGCFQAAEGEDVLRLCASHQIDFLLLDTHLTGIGAEQLLQALPTRHDDSAIPFMITSADASSARIERLLALGASDYVLKPFPIPTLCARLEKALTTLHASN
jgi:two-component system chemotaxis response regulator CheY